MFDFSYEQLFVGQRQQFPCSITEEMQKAFFEMSRDNNPLHLDEAFAQNRGFSRRVVHGVNIPITGGSEF